VSEPPAADAPRGVLGLVHHHPGRLRVRAEVFRSGDAADRARAALEAVPGITGATHNAKTGSLLIEYQPGLAEPEAILARVAAAAGLAPPSEDDRARRREPALVAIEVTREINEVVGTVMNHQADLRSLVPAGMALLAGYSLLTQKGPKLPRWDNLLYWSYNIFTQLHRREIESTAAAPRAAVLDAEEQGAASAGGPRVKPAP
jgi:hypothetical protein